MIFLNIFKLISETTHIKPSRLTATDSKILEAAKKNIAKMKELAARGELFRKPPKLEPLKFSRFPAMQGLPYFDCQILPNGAVYQGEVVNGFPLGPGTMFYPSGTLCEAYFDCEKVEGKGRVVFPSGLTYEGSFKNGMLHGEGKISYLGKIVYEGRFYENEMQEEKEK